MTDNPDDGTDDPVTEEFEPARGHLSTDRRARAAESQRETTVTDGDETPPLDELLRRIAAERRDGYDEDPFEVVEVADVSPEEAWATLADDERIAGVENHDGAGVTAIAAADPAAAEPDYLVPKAAYCQRCRYFSAPPTVACTHRGGTIVEVIDSERFRVHGCPMVGGDDPNRFE